MGEEDFHNVHVRNMAGQPLLLAEAWTETTKSNQTRVPAVLEVSLVNDWPVIYRTQLLIFRQFGNSDLTSR